MAEQLISTLHRDLLRMVSKQEGQQFEGLRVAARQLWRQNRINNTTEKKFLEVEAAYNLLRRITVISAHKLMDRVKDCFADAATQQHATGNIAVEKPTGNQDDIESLDSGVHAGIDVHSSGYANFQEPTLGTASAADNPATSGELEARIKAPAVMLQRMQPQTHRHGL